jgi:hypothetical protein
VTANILELIGHTPLVQVQRLDTGRCRLFLANQQFRKGNGNVGPTLTWLNLESKEEVDELYRMWSGSNATLIAAPESKSWGLHEFTAADLDGNLFRVFYDFATPERARGSRSIWRTTSTSIPVPIAFTKYSASPPPSPQTTRPASNSRVRPFTTAS